MQRILYPNIWSFFKNEYAMSMYKHVYVLRMENKADYHAFRSLTWSNFSIIYKFSPVYRHGNSVLIRFPDYLDSANLSDLKLFCFSWINKFIGWLGSGPDQYLADCVSAELKGEECRIKVLQPTMMSDKSTAMATLCLFRRIPFERISSD